MGSRIICICDAIDAMTSDRAYRNALTWRSCREEIEKNKGLQLDPQLVEAVDSLWTHWENRERVFAIENLESNSLQKRNL